MNPPTDLHQLMVTAWELMNAIMPIVLVIFMISTGAGLMQTIIKQIRTIYGDDFPRALPQKRKTDEFYSPMDGIEYETANGYLLPKRKNDQPVRLGDDGELIYPDQEE